MESNRSILRLIYPQWQGGMVAHWMPDIPAADASRGYYLGAQLLKFLAPETGQKTMEVPVSLDMSDRAPEKGVSSREAILTQTKAALDILRAEKPDRIVTLGGECSVSVVPFTYLASRYPDDVAVVWIDAHPDINLPYDGYSGYHAMALTACLGRGDEEITGILPGKFDASKVIVVGLRSWDEGMQKRQRELKIKGVAPSEVADGSAPVLEWLERTGVSKVVIHFDLDVIDPAEMIAGVGVEPDGMKMEEAVRLIRDISFQYEVVGLTVAEPMPRVAIKIRNMLAQLPLLNSRGNGSKSYKKV